MSFENDVKSPGISVNTTIMLIMIALIKTMLISKPILKRIKPIAASPESVVKQLRNLGNGF